MASVCKPGQAAATNPGAVLGAAMGEAWKQGRDKLTIISDPAWNSFGSWLEQLIAESSGKSGRGLVPVDMEPEVQPEMYGQDRLFVYLRRDGSRDAFINELIQFHHPVLQLDIHDISDLGGLFYQWEIAVALACSILQVNPFDQPDVQDSKTRTQAKIDGIRQGQPLAQKSPAWTRNGVNLYADIRETKENVNSLSALILEILTGQG